MIRFSAGREEIAALLKFLRRRAPNAHLTMAPLAVAQNGRRSDFRLRHTPRPLLRRLSMDATATLWGIFTDLDAAYLKENRPTEENCLILLQLGPADATGRREGLLEARDELVGNPPQLTPRAEMARRLVERSARRVRRRGVQKDGHWFMPD